jgi:hypothetical protein
MADTLTVTDNRTGKQYEIPIKDGVINASSSWPSSPPISKRPISSSLASCRPRRS